MARIARVVAPLYPHHITQRGNRRQQTFFNDEDYLAYLELMSEWCREYRVEAWAYCLMPNHVHLILVPETKDGLNLAVGKAHKRYTRRINFREGWSGHLWQGRFASFVTRKITRTLARIALGLQDCLYLGNLDARRDWGHAKDYVQMQWLMLQQDTPEDYVIATGEQHSVREFVEIAAAALGIEILWQGNGKEEKGMVAGVNTPDTPLKKGQQIVFVDPRYFRPTEVETLLGDPTKARTKLGWVPRTSFDTLVREMVAQDLESARRDKLCADAGFKVCAYNE